MQQYAQHYTFIGIFLLAALVFPAIPLILQRFVAPRKPTREKLASYECGIAEAGDSWLQFRVQYYVYAFLFVIFDVEAVFILPCAVAMRGVGVASLAAIGVFLIVLFIGLVYEWRRGLLEWQ